jgi:hypothetical protein
MLIHSLSCLSLILMFVHSLHVEEIYRREVEAYPVAVLVVGGLLLVADGLELELAPHPHPDLYIGAPYPYPCPYP